MLSKLKRMIRNYQFDSKNYWESRYQKGGNSGSGSYGKLADFKARILNEFVKENQINTVIEFGCGDGHQASLATYPNYVGLDVSATVIKQCIEKFKNDPSKSFFLYDQECFSDKFGFLKCDLSLSLDVLYHLVEQKVYDQYLINLFASGKQYVIVYSSNVHIPPANEMSHEFHRKFTDDVARLAPKWELFKELENEYSPANYADESGSMANFYFFRLKK
ncbi:MAG: class I SAM-dependent methyltransferase [Pseudobacter sp.]|uniref:class I SAM-dependent methyltransferase n=1 Tax=Pseudobacter sp. TaxID=2045420 RepID=UPI003F7FF6C9